VNLSRSTFIDRPLHIEVIPASHGTSPETTSEPQ
jgi:hypothetical protein